MKIVYLTQHFPPESQAAAFRAYETAKKLAEGGMEVYIITGFPNLAGVRKEAPFRRKLVVRERIGPLHVTRLYTPLDTKNSSLVRLLNYSSFMLLAFLYGLFLPRPAVYYASTPPLFVSLPALALSKLKRAKFILEVRDLWVDFAILLGQLKGKRLISFARRVEKLATRAADTIVVVTAGYKEHYVKQGIDRQKIKVIYGGVDFENPVFGHTGRGEEVRQQLGLGDKFVVGYAGNIGYAQGLDVVLAAAELLGREEDFCFMLVGDGADKQRLLRLKEEKNLKNVIFCSQVPREEIAGYVQSFDCCLVTLLKDPLFEITLPSKLFEAMAFRKPVLLGLDGEAREIIERAGAGIYFPLDDPERLVEAILDLKDNRDEAQAMAQRGYHFARENFNRDLLVEQLSEILQQCGKKKG